MRRDIDDEWHSIDATINRAHQRAAGGKRLADKGDLYKARSAVECAFNLLKQARRFATRDDKTLRNHAAVVAARSIARSACTR